jgi:hypothetical protein
MFAIMLAFVVAYLLFAAFTVVMIRDDRLDTQRHDRDGRSRPAANR